MEQKITPTPSPEQSTKPAAKPNEQGVLNIDDFVRIYDPNSQQVLVEKRS